MLITDTLSPQAFEEALRAKGAFYHIHHPYHIAMHNGDATREQIQGWVANRFYYQTTIPLKDAAIMANLPGCANPAQMGAADPRPRRQPRRGRRD
ncbi:coenzyme PQQ synthesis protein C [Klebsiella pneumoniae]|nr:coenzyme PQQ synthesis protein C [Klebsiella pneumoniae]